jgi:hypothetical protein
MPRDYASGITEHVDRLHAALFETYDLQDVVRYITDKTYLAGDRYSFKDHEFQETILSDTSRVVNVQKCAQVGMSEAMARYVVGLCRIIPYFSAILTMPYSGDATKFVKTRINPIINDSPDLAGAVNPDLDNTEIKEIGTSLFYARGTSGETAALSVPADLLVHDEIDRSDPHTIQQYQSRIKHSSWKLTRKFGTPTIDGVGIALEMASSLRKHHFCKCHHCNHQFIPSYHTDVVIPGYTGELRDITRDNIQRLNWRDAHLVCPKCGKTPSLAPEYREWVIENPGDMLEAIGYYVTPFSVPNVVPVPQIVLESTKFLWHEFCNQTLGETNSEAGEELTRDDITACKYTGGTLETASLHSMGIDMGITCHVTIGRLTLEGQMLVVHRERVPLTNFKQRYHELRAKYRVLVTVMDGYPYTDIVYELQKVDANLYGAIYHNSKKMEAFAIAKAEEDEDKGKLPITQVKIHRNQNFDTVMGLFKRRELVWAVGDENDAAIFEGHCLAMKRKKELDNHGEVVYTWHKPTDGQDHYMHSIGYLNVACRLQNAAARDVVPTSAVTLFGKIRAATREETNMYGQKQRGAYYRR